MPTPNIQQQPPNIQQQQTDADKHLLEVRADAETALNRAREITQEGILAEQHKAEQERHRAGLVDRKTEQFTFENQDNQPKTSQTSWGIPGYIIAAIMELNFRDERAVEKAIAMIRDAVATGKMSTTEATHAVAVLKQAHTHEEKMGILHDALRLSTHIQPSLPSLQQPSAPHLQPSAPPREDEQEFGQRMQSLLSADHANAGQGQQFVDIQRAVYAQQQPADLRMTAFRVATAIAMFLFDNQKFTTLNGGRSNEVAATAFADTAVASSLYLSEDINVQSMLGGYTYTRNRGRATVHEGSFRAQADRQAETSYTDYASPFDLAKLLSLKPGASRNHSEEEEVIDPMTGHRIRRPKMGR